MLVNQFIDNEDSIYAYRPDVLLSKRSEVQVNDDAPAYSSKRSYSSGSKSSARGRKKGRSRHGKREVSIRNGDTLSDIARRNGTTVKKLKKLNNIKGTNIRAGKKLRVK